MSFRVISSLVTASGIHLGELTELTVPHFQIHECGFSSRIEDWNFDEMLCPFWCLWHVMDKGSWIESGGDRWDLGADCIVLKPAHIIHSTHSCRPAPQLWLHFSLMPDYAFDASVPFKIPMNSLLRQQIKALINVYSAAEGDNRVLYHHAAALLNNCFTQHPLPLRVLPDELRRVLQRIESTPAGDLSNATLARMTNQSLSSFIRWFELHMHQPPATYVRGVRHQKASKMLIFSDLSIEQIARETGYPNRHYFSRAFAQNAGLGPATFRKRHGK